MMTWWIWLMIVLVVLAVVYYGYTWYYAVPQTYTEQEEGQQQEITDENTE